MSDHTTPEKRPLLIVGGCVVRNRAVLVAPVARETVKDVIYGAVACLNTKGESFQAFGEIQETKRRSGRVLYCVEDNAEVYDAVFPDVKLTCCQCKSPARAQLNGRFYCFTHVPLMTNWQPVKKGKSK